jgi:integrase
MSYPQRVGNVRSGKLTGKFFGEVDYRGKRFRRLCDTKPEADGYEAYVRATGSEPLHSAGAKHTGTTFREVAELCKAAGGPRKGKWKGGRDKSVMQRLDLVMTHLGDLDIAAVGTTELDKLVASLQRRPGNHGERLSAGTINRYLTAASAVLTFASQRGFIQGKPAIPLQTEDGGREETVSDELEKRLWAWMTDQGHHAERLCCQVLIETGMRAGELHAIRPDQIVNEWITLRAAQVKTNKPRRVYIEPSWRGFARADRGRQASECSAHWHAIFKSAPKP